MFNHLIPVLVILGLVDYVGYQVLLGLEEMVLLPEVEELLGLAPQRPLAAVGQDLPDQAALVYLLEG